MDAPVWNNLGREKYAMVKTLKKVFFIIEKELIHENIMI